MSFSHLPPKNSTQPQFFSLSCSIVGLPPTQKSSPSAFQLLHRLTPALASSKIVSSRKICLLQSLKVVCVPMTIFESAFGFACVLQRSHPLLLLKLVSTGMMRKYFCSWMSKHGACLPDNVLAGSSSYLYRPSNLPEGICYLVLSNEKKESVFEFWKPKGQACKIYSNSVINGWRSTLEYYKGEVHDAPITDWVMQEYSITQKKLLGEKNNPKNSVHAVWKAKEKLLYCLDNSQRRIQTVRFTLFKEEPCGH